jgi:hypothetical protein
MNRWYTQALTVDSFQDKRNEYMGKLRTSREDVIISAACQLVDYHTTEADAIVKSVIDKPLSDRIRNEVEKCIKNRTSGVK